MDTTPILTGQATVAKQSASQSLDRMRVLYRPVLNELARVEERLQRELQSPYESVAPILRHGVQLGGKRLRPAMHLLCADAVGDVTDDNIVVAAVLEMVHTATLIHDDILDEADTRRHLPTISSKWNDHTGLLLGDYLFAQSFSLAATLSSTEVCRWIGEASRLVCEGELRQVLQRDHLTIDLDSYLSMIRGKTAELCCVASRLAGLLSGADKKVTDSLAKYGLQLGIAFQIADDYLDLWGEDGTVGKTLGTDIAQGKITLPLIRVLETASETDRETLREILSGSPEKRLDAIMPWLNQSDAQRYTLHMARWYQAEAIEQLDVLDDSDAKESLIAIARFAVDRHF